MDLPVFPILFEDEFIVVIDKPAGVVVNRAESVKAVTVQDWMDGKYPIRDFQPDATISSTEEGYDPVVEFVNRSGVVHRLDKDTSGVLLLSKDPVTFEKLKAQFKERVVQKKYRALVHGRVEPPKAEISAPIGRLPWNRTRFGVFTGGRESQTAYQVQQYYLHKGTEPLTLLSLTPHTGRTHQIRVHMQYINHPLVGDELYAGRKRSRSDRDWCPRIFLHAEELSFSHPETGKKMQVKSQVPQELADVLAELQPLSE